MKKTGVFSLFLLCACPVCFGQATEPVYGRITRQEVEMNSYALDKSCEAVVLYDIGKSSFSDTDEGFELVFERKTRIKILAKSGLRWAELEIPYYTDGSKGERITEIEAVSYNLEEGVVKQTILDPKKIYDEKTSDHWRQIKFAIPDVKEGSVIEYKYTLSSPYMFNIQDWKFQRTIPTRYSDYTVKITPFYEYIYIMTGQKYLSVKESYTDTGLPRHLGSLEYRDVVYRFVMKNVPAFTDESYITAMNDYIFQIDFQLSRIHLLDGSSSDIITTWPNMVSELLKNSDFGTYMRNAEKAAGDLINPQELSGKSKLEQLEMLVNFVKASFSWNGITNEFVTKSVKDFLKEKTGNSANINLFLTGFLNAAGFEAYPVIISTRDHGKINSDYPFAHFFNNVIVLVYIDGKPVLTDATQALCPYNTIPPWCINEKGLVVKKNAEEWVLLTNQERSSLRHDFVLAFESGGDTLNCNLRISASYYDAFNYRKEYQDDTEKVATNFLNKGYAAVDSVILSNFEDVLKNYILSVNLKNTTDRAEDKIYLSPFMLETPEENPLTQAARHYPVDMTYLKSRIFNSVITLPEGYIPEYIPVNYALKTNYLDVEYNAVIIGDHTLKVSAKYDFKKALYEPGEYSNLRYTLNEIIKKLNEKIVLKRAVIPST